MKIAVGLSGGVDSSVAAYLLKKQGHDVMGIFMQNWHDTTGTLHGDCEWEEDADIARLVAKKLDIPFHFVDLSKIYKQKVVDYMFSEYEKGRTPNPDVLCNREIKFDVFLKEALKLGADYVATGHYCKKNEIAIDGKITYKLLAGTDKNKDQSYFLCQLSQAQLAKSLFPIGHLIKSQVRQIATEQGLPTAQRKDSQGICFVGRIDLPVFLQQKLAAKQGFTVEIMPEYYAKTHQLQNDEMTVEQLAKPYIYRFNSGKKIGNHNGAHFFTIGQRKGINIGGHVEPLFVIGTDVEENILYVGEGFKHIGLFRKALLIKNEEIHYVRPDLKINDGETRDYWVRIRYRQPLQKAKTIKKESGLYILFDEPQRGIASGQFAAWYNGDELIGSGIINA